MLLERHAYERWFAKIKLLLDGQGELACHHKAFQPPIPDSQGQVSSNKLTYIRFSLFLGWL